MPEDARQGIQRVEYTSRFLDRTMDPPMYTDEELPTTIILGSRTRRTLAAGLGTIATTHQSSGSLREFTPGTYGFRVTRVSIGWGTAGQRWAIWHSRIGTIDQLTPTGPGRSGVSGNYGQTVLQGGPRTPVYVLPAGTISWAFTGTQPTKAAVSQIIEAVPIIRIPEQI